MGALAGIIRAAHGGRPRRRNARSFLLATALAVVTPCVLSAQALAAAPTVPLLTDGTVSSIVDSGSNIYVAGRFSRVSTTPLGQAATIDGSSATASAAAAQVVGGQVLATIPDGSGGWYFGGTFTSVGGQTRSGLAHLLASGALDTSFAPHIEEPFSFNKVDALALSGGTLYVGGTFAKVGGQAQANLAAVSASTGALISSFAPVVSGSTTTSGASSGGVSALALSGGTLYVGGAFATVDGQSRADLAAVDTSDGTLVTAFAPTISIGAGAGCTSVCGSEVNALTLSGGQLYLGGQFDHVDGQAQSALAAVSPADGSFDASFVPVVAQAFASQTPVVTTLLASPGSLYVGGLFAKVGGEGHSNLAAVSLTTGAVVSAFTANAGGQGGLTNLGFGVVTSLALEGTTLYVGGGFSSVNSSARSNLAAVAAASGAVLPWNPEPAGGIDALAAASGEVEASGDVRFLGGTPRSSLLALNEDGSLNSSFAPTLTGVLPAVTHLALSGGVVYLSGSFSSVDGQFRMGLAAVSATDGSLDTAFAPAASGVADIAAAEGRLYLAGGFTQVDGQSRSSLVAVSLTDGSLVASFAPTGVGGNGVTSMATATGVVYVAGSHFTQIDGQSVPGLAALRSSDGSLVPGFSPGITTSEVFALATDGTRLYVSGNLTTSEGATKLAALDTSNGSLDSSFNVSHESLGSIDTLVLAAEDLFIGGNFEFNNTPSIEALALNATSGSVDGAFTPLLLGAESQGNLSSEVDALAANSSRVYLGGNFESVGTVPAGGLVGVSISPGPSCSAVNTSATAGTPMVINLACSDPGADSLSYSVTAPPSHGTLSTPDSNGQITYTATAGFTGTDSFTYLATGADGSSQPATVTITVSSPSPGGEEHSGSGGSNGGGTGSGGGGSTSTASGSSQAGGGAQTSQAGPSPSAVTAALAALLGGKGPLPTITSLLKTGGYSLSFNAPGAGVLAVQWTTVSAQASRHARHKAKKVVIASGSQTFSVAGIGTVKVRLTAAGRKLLKKNQTLRVTDQAMFTPSSGAAQTKQATLTIRAGKKSIRR